MTLVQILFETGPQGTALSSGNSGSSTQSVAGGTHIFDTATKAHGNFGAKFTNAAAASTFRRWLFAAPATTWQFSGVITMPASTPATNMVVASFCNTGGAGRVQILVDTSMRLGVQGAGGAGTTNITAALTAGAKYRVTLQVVGGSTTASSVTAKVYSEAGGAWTTQVGSTWTSSTFNTGTDQAVGVDLGVATTMASAYSIGWDDIQLNDGTGSEIGDIVTALATPVVTLGTTTHPTTVGGTNGSQVVTYANVSGAVSYVARIAQTLTPTEGDFVDVGTATGGTYTFTGLDAGPYAFGIKAKA